MAPSDRRCSRLVPALLVLLGVLGALEASGRILGFPRVTPTDFARAAWSVASGAASGARPSDEVLAGMVYRPLPYVNFGLKPSWARREGADGLRRTSNALGFRGREVEVPKPPGRYRIVCLGGSTTYDEAVGDDETYPVKLEGMLRGARPDRDVEVVNAGVPSYTSAESLANLAFRVLDLEPDAIVLYEGINDWRPRTYPDFDGAYFHYRKVWDGTARAWETGAGDLAGLNINQFVQHPAPESEVGRAETVRRNGTAAFRRNLVSMSGIARAHGVAVVMVSNTVAEDDPACWPDFLEGIAEHNRVVREVCAAEGALFVDLDAVFPKGERVPPGGLFRGLAHNNPAGAELKARAIADALLASLLR